MLDYEVPMEKVTIDFVQIDREGETLNLHLMFMENGIGHHYTISTDWMLVIGCFNPKVVANWCKEWKLTNDIRIKN